MKLLTSTLIACLVILGSAPSAFADKYVIDQGHSSINTKFKHVGISWLKAEFKSFSGSIEYDPENISASSVAVEIDVTSIDSNHELRDEHMIDESHLNAAQFPTASFASNSVMDKGDGNMTINGNLTLHGVTNEVAIETTIAGEGETRWGDYRMGFEGTTTLDMREFGLDNYGPTNMVEMSLLLEVVKEAAE
jgi:polyisoprenoid-binding protein YceI